MNTPCIGLFRVPFLSAATVADDKQSVQHWSDNDAMPSELCYGQDVECKSYSSQAT